MQTSNLHVPLPEDLDAALRSECDRSGESKTQFAREAIALLLEQRHREALHQEIAAFAAAAAGTDHDLDAAFEAASVEDLLEAESDQ